MSVPNDPQEPRYGRRLPGYGQQQPAAGGSDPYAPQPGYSTQPGRSPQPAYSPQPEYSSPTGPPGKQPSRVAPVLLIVVAALATILGPIIGLITGASQALSGLEDLDVGTEIANGGTTDLPANTELGVYVTAVYDEGLDCTITDPSGGALDAEPVTIGDMAEPSMGLTFTTNEAGSYTFDCAMPGGSEQTLLVTSPMTADDVIGAGVPVVIGLAVGFVGLVLLIVAIVWLVRTNRRIRTAQSYPRTW